jgi:hypothetical protein
MASANPSAFAVGAGLFGYHDCMRPITLTVEGSIEGEAPRGPAALLSSARLGCHRSS